MSTYVTIDLRDRNNAVKLFSYPNAGHDDQSLEQTIEHYFGDSLTREGLGNFSIAAGDYGGSYGVRVTVDDVGVAQQIRDRYQAFFDLGSTGLQDSEAFKASGKWDVTWEFLLPLGVAIAFALSVEVMDFPPLTLISNQDYLKSKTTSRWWELLLINGVKDQEKAKYSCILDIVPVAAPASDGTKLDHSGIYNGPFDTYTGLLELLAKSQIAGLQRPLMALGMPIRTWILRLWNLAICRRCGIDWIEKWGQLPGDGLEPPQLFLLRGPPANGGGRGGQEPGCRLGGNEAGHRCSSMAGRDGR
jgi:hypothetical protein